MTDVRDLQFWTEEGHTVPAVSAEKMREVDRMAAEAFGLDLLQMMENAGRNLAENVMDMAGAASGEVTVLAGAGGNGGGGLCCARHLHNRGFRVNLILDREPSALKGAAGAQLCTLQAAGLGPVGRFEFEEVIQRAGIVLDALIGYSLRGAPRGRAAWLIELCNEHAAQVLALDVPSGLDATTGAKPGLVVRAHRTMTLALPKTGLRDLAGDLYLADIGIPPEVYERLGLSFEPFFKDRFWIPLRRTEGDSMA